MCVVESMPKGFRIVESEIDLFCISADAKQSLFDGVFIDTIE